MNIEWAVNADGNPVHLPAVDFIKIYTGVNQYCGWLGETSTEILGVTDLHPEAVLSSIDNQSVRVSLLRKNDFLLVQNLEKVSQISIYDLKGILVTTTQNSQSININSLPDGIFIVKIVDTSGNQHIEKIFIN
ncbi:MAG: T9SS type A sorting domain-containing protein, partial [Paludibacteraceae bacterium]